MDDTRREKRAPSSVSAIVEPRDGACRVRGFGLLNSMHFVHHRAGSDGVKRVLRHLSEDDLARVQNIERLRWYPFALHCRLLRAVDRGLGFDDLRLLYDVGRHSAERDWPTFFRPLLKVGRAGFMLEVATKLWRLFHGVGTWELERSPRAIIARLNGWDEPDDAYCASFMGYMTVALELSGAVDIDVTHAICAAHGGAQCVYTVRWCAPGESNDEPTVPGFQNLDDNWR